MERHHLERYGICCFLPWLAECNDCVVTRGITFGVGMKKFLLGALLLTGCANKRMVGIDMNNLSGSPCIDGVIYNIKQAGCEVFYWGHTRDASAVKLRCTYADHENFYTESTFYAMPLGAEMQAEGIYMPWCIDTETMVYLAIPDGVIDLASPQQ